MRPPTLSTPNAYLLPNNRWASCSPDAVRRSTYPTSRPDSAGKSQFASSATTANAASGSTAIDSFGGALHLVQLNVPLAYERDEFRPNLCDGSFGTRLAHALD